MSRRTAKATLVALGLLFLLPLALAWLMYTGVIDLRPRETSNRGILIEPPVEARLPDALTLPGLEKHWMLIYPLPLECGERCREDFVGLRQVRRALGRDGDRIRIVGLTVLDVEHPAVQAISAMNADALVVRDSSGMLASQLQRIGGSGSYLLDPLGNIMMHYPQGSRPDDIRRDLEHLLRYAKTDPQ